MLAIVFALTFGVCRLPLGRLERCSHALAGSVVLLCGIAIHLGL
jgi:hypothetical protein